MRFADRHCVITETFEPYHQYHFTGQCIITGKEVTVSVKGDELFNYRQGGYIQNTLVSNNADEREFLMSGISPDGWDKTFGK